MVHPANAKSDAFTALVVDGADYHRSISADLMRSAGAERVFTASSSDDALRIAADMQPGMILADWAIAPMSALTFARRIRSGAEGVRRNTPILLMAYRVSLADVEAARAAGVDAVLAKPTSIGAVRERVRAIQQDTRPFIVSPNYVGPCRRRRMLGAEYTGPLRRLTDPQAALPAPDTAADQQTQARAKECLVRLSLATQDLKAGDLAAAQSVLARVFELRSIAMDNHDSQLAAAASDLHRYVEGLGATPHLSTEALTVHLDALDRLIAIPRARTVERLRLAEGLRAMIDRKLASSRSA